MAQLSMSMSLARQAAAAQAETDAVRRELAEIVAEKEALASRESLGRIPVWAGFGAVLAAAAVYALMFPQTHPAGIQEKPRKVTFFNTRFNTRPSGLERSAGKPVMASDSNRNPVERALDRLDAVVERVPAQISIVVLSEANRRLAESGLSPCATTLLEGRPSLVISAKDKPLAAALERCADVIEQIVH